jgi:tRNA(fMet)-specific endonuclease VapC
MYLIDTDTVIYNLKGNLEVARNLKEHIHDPMKLSVVTLMELYYGAHKSREVAGNLAKIRTLETVFDILPVSSECAEIFGMQKTALEREGRPLDDLDLILASSALAYNLVLVTNNTRHFGRISGLRLANWTTYPEARV